MSQQLINRSTDLKKLRDNGYEIEICGAFLLMHHIPYINSKKEINYGTLVSELTLSGNKSTIPSTHVVHFIGEHPCGKDGSIITAIIHASNTTKLEENLIVNHSFSNKPKNGSYNNYFDKMSRYADIISAPAKSLDKNVTDRTFKVVSSEDSESVFNYLDTNESRASIYEINSKFKRQKIAIIGLGGSGAYILDQVAKTPVQEIHLFDGDVFLQHNAFRSPGAASLDDLSKELKKTDYYKSIYSRMHKFIFSHPFYITEKNIELLIDFDYVFICVDKNSVRKQILEYLISKKVSFIDVGLGVNIAEKNLVGTVRVTASTIHKSDHLFSRVSSCDIDENEYQTNIQIADLNALGAVLAIIKWKKLSGFYQDFKNEHHTSYSINVSQLQNEDYTT